MLSLANRVGSVGTLAFYVYARSKTGSHGNDYVDIRRKGQRLAKYNMISNTFIDTTTQFTKTDEKISFEFINNKKEAILKEIEQMRSV